MNGIKWRTRTNRSARFLRAGVGGALLLSLLTACSSDGSGGSDEASASAGAVRQPPVNAPFDYQLGGPYPPPAKVRAVSRDRTADPVPGHYNICYVNAFQAQPGADAARWWQREHPDLILRDDDGDPVVDEDWQEPLLDISTKKKRAVLAEIVGRWIEGCGTAGFDAVEPDNLDSYERSDDLLTKDDAAAFARLLAERAHAKGLAIAQKNTTDLIGEHRKIGFDFAVTEECAHYKECPEYKKAYDGKVFDIEYTTKDFDAACRKWGEKLSITLRDRDVSAKGEDKYVYRHC